MISRFDILIYIFILITLSGCKKIDSPEQESNSGEQQVTLRLLMPQSDNKAGTYAISEADQNSIHSLDVLAFRIADDGKEYYAYHKQAVLLRPGDNAAAVDFHVDLLKSTDKFRFVLIANAATQLQTALSGLPVNTEKETLMSRMEYGIMTKWNAGSSGNFTPLPMWGESMMIDGINNNTQKFSVSMLRSLAAIDIKVTADNFVMTQVYVYNMSGKGRIAPVAGNYDAAEYKVKAPSIPAGTNRLTAQEYTSGTTGLAGEIFLFESTAPGNTGDSNATGLVIAGKYAGSSDITYYRVELTDDQQKLLPVLRNHRYAIDITKVHAAGFSSQALAWASKPVSMSATVTAWNEVSVSDSNIGAPQFLKLSMDSVTIKRSAQTLLLEVRTNDLSAMTLTDIPNWITVTRQNDAEKATFTLKIPTYTSPLRVRVAKLAVNAGRIKKIITIIQSPPPIDIGLPFLVSGSNLSGEKIPWYKRANVEYGVYVNSDASQTQKPGTPYPESCAALGAGYRLPTYNELIQLVPPTSPSERQNIDYQLGIKGGLAINNASYITAYLSSSTSSYQGNNKWYSGLSNGSGGAGTNGVYSQITYPKSDYVWNYEISRCIMSKSDAPPL
ncbi:BACON domain-containing protein [Sphingobacterium spiritivorum]|nr:BACON domain-containing protein [Sphingobacterium spiritivorum]QQS97093.1 BACON domain-containing protein [Sphingobacterium spiritivorum]